MKLISEAIENVEYICEENDGNKSYKIRGIFMQGDIKNRNGRVYPMEVLTNEVKNYNRKFVNEKRAYGELGHPEGPTVNLERVSHLVTELYPDGKNIMGEARILDTPMGKIVKTLMDEGTELAVGLHIANNLITALLVTADWTAFQTESLYTCLLYTSPSPRD